jgi:hypothetical protein
VRSLHFAVFGDLGARGDGRGDATMDYLNDLVNDETDPISLIFHTGDVGYADDSFLHVGCVDKWVPVRRSKPHTLTRARVPGSAMRTCGTPT